MQWKFIRDGGQVSNEIHHLIEYYKQVCLSMDSGDILPTIELCIRYCDICRDYRVEIPIWYEWLCYSYLSCVSTGSSGSAQAIPDLFKKKVLFLEPSPIVAS